MPASPARFFRSLIRLVVFFLFTWIAWWLVAKMITPLVDMLVASALSLAVAVVSITAVMMRIYELQPFYVVGFFWNRVALAHLKMGLALGAGSSLLIVLIQWAGGWVRLERIGPIPNAWATFLFGFFILAVGATGEELLFRGYGFQHLICAFGPWFSILFTSGLFALAHTANPSFSRLSLINTGLFGLVFGYAYWRTRDLWLPLGMHFAWNFSLTTIGATVSGLKIKLTAVSVVSAGSRLWSGGDYGPEASLVTSFVLLATMGLLWKRPPARQQQGIVAAQYGGRT
ncbi:MAG: CPBP family intramembrane metalloprotease [Acidobacteria bacterium]|nr:CPBP family intramembrane metalloprotease [Acidobacteriota bacterium]